MPPAASAPPVIRPRRVTVSPSNAPGDAAVGRVAATSFSGFLERSATEVRSVPATRGGGAEHPPPRTAVAPTAPRVAGPGALGGRPELVGPLGRPRRAPPRTARSGRPARPRPPGRPPRPAGPGPARRGRRRRAGAGPRPCPRTPRRAVVQEVALVDGLEHEQPVGSSTTLGEAARPGLGHGVRGQRRVGRARGRSRSTAHAREAPPRAASSVRSTWSRCGRAREPGLELRRRRVDAAVEQRAAEGGVGLERRTPGRPS